MVVAGAPRITKRGEGMKQLLLVGPAFLALAASHPAAEVSEPVSIALPGRGLASLAVMWRRRRAEV
jgi:hypothetical protein